MTIIEKFIEFIWDRKYLTKDQKDELEMDIRCNSNLESEWQSKEAQIKELAEEIKQLETKMDKLEKIKEAIQDILTE